VEVAIPPSDRQRNKTLDAAVLLVIAVIILVGCFGRTVLTGKEISKLPVLASEDQFFDNSLRFSVPRPRFDPSLYQFHVPFQLYVHEELKNFRLPLWNPCFGCGFPTIGELQYCTFSPFRSIFQASNSYLYNLGIVIKCLIAALGTFALCRLFAFTTAASAFAGLAYALCPFVLRELELPNEVQFIPLLSAAFLYLTGSKSFLKATCLGACTSVALASMHPEFFFISIFNSLLTLLAAKTFQKSQDLSSQAKIVLTAGIVGIGFGAPLLLPFFELLSFSDSYKFHSATIQFVDFKTLIAGLITPVCAGGSAFAGAVVLLLASFALVAGGRRAFSIFGLVLLYVVWASLPGPLLSMAEVKPLSLIPPRYMLAPMLLNVILLSAYGFDLLAGAVAERRRKQLILLALAATFLSLCPYLLLAGQIALPGYDGTLPLPAVQRQEALKGIISITIALSTILALSFLKARYNKYLLPIILIATNLISIGDSCRVALGPTFPFNYRVTPAIEELKKKGQRFVATGTLFFPPNISMVYNLRDFRLTGPLLPKSITKLQGIRQTHEGTDSRSIFFSPVNDAASVGYILTRWPKYSTLDREIEFKPFPLLKRFPLFLFAEKEDLLIDSASYCLSKNGELFVKFHWKTRAEQIAPYAAELDIVDGRGKDLAKGQRLPFLPGKDNFTTQTMSVKIPHFQSLSEDGYAVLRIFNCFTEGMLPLQKSDLPMRALGLELLKISPETSDQTDLSNARLQLIYEDSDQVLIYKNRGAMPEAYLTSAIVFVKSLAEAAEIMEDSRFNPRETTIIEAAEQIASGISRPQIKENGKNPQGNSPRVTRRDPNTVLVEYESSEDAFLILTDTFYSGWHAYLDGEEQPIYRANLAFRAVKVPPGKHELKFVFLPASFYGGGIIAILTALGVLLASLKRKKK
jgi:hypothetical protein